MINRHNYEEFFLMYADNELTAQQRTAVELFLKQNPDLVAELDMFMQVKLGPEEDIVFNGKEALYKKADADINIHNYEEFFLLYVDSELSQADSEKVEKFVLQHPQLQDEFTLLKQTILQPEAITFGDKSSLYRQEGRRRVVPLFSFMRVAVAAAIIGVAVLGWWLYPQQQGTIPAGPAVAVKTTPAKKQATPGADKTLTPVITPQVQQAAEAQQNTAVVNKTPKRQIKIVTPVVNQQKAIDIPAQVNNSTVNNDLLAENKQDRPKENAVVTNPVSTNPIADNSITQVTAKPDVKPIVIDIDQIRRDELNNKGAVAQADNVYPVAYKVIDTDEDNKSMYVGALELNKDKVKGFLKRVFGGKTKRDIEN